MNRRILATASLGIVGASWIVLGATTRFGGAHTVVAGVFTGAAALLYLGRSALSQVVARAAALAVVVPWAFSCWLSWTHAFRGVSWSGLALPALAAASLVVARPLLHTDESRATFAPIAMRSWFLAAATAAIGIGIAVLGLAVECAFVHLFGGALLLGALAASLIGSGVGVMRMRGWGVLLGAVSAILGVAVAFVNHRFFGWAPLWLAAPGAITTAALLAARAGIGHAPPATSVSAAAPPSPARYRVAPLTEPDAIDLQPLEVDVSYERRAASR